MHCTLETDIHIPRLGFHFHIFTLPFKILLLAGERGGGYFWTGNTISSVQILEESSQKYFMQEDSYLKQGMH